MAPLPHHNYVPPRIWLTTGLDSSPCWPGQKTGLVPGFCLPVHLLFFFSCRNLLSSPHTFGIRWVFMCVVSPPSKSSPDTSWASCNPALTQATLVVSAYQGWSVWSPEVSTSLTPITSPGLFYRWFWLTSYKEIDLIWFGYFVEGAYRPQEKQFSHGS